MLSKEVLARIQKYVHPFRVTRGKGFQLKDFDPGDTCDLKLGKSDAAELLQRGIEWLAEEQGMLYGQNRWSLLLVFQALDAAGKDRSKSSRLPGLLIQATLSRGSRSRFYVALHLTAWLSEAGVLPECITQGAEEAFENCRPLPCEVVLKVGNVGQPLIPNAIAHE
jgi:hypothetical protein